jgi:hypothetical protein
MKWLFMLILTCITGTVAVTLIRFASRRRLKARLHYIRDYRFPPGLFEKLHKKHPDLSERDCELVGSALRQYFYTYLQSGRRHVSMPSQAADDLWHEMILYTKAYEAFCRKAFGRFLHHTPAVVLGSSRKSNTGLRRCWWYACLEENMSPRAPHRLPLLFRLDEQLNIADGFYYALDCSGFRETQRRLPGATVIYCGGDFAGPGAGFDEIIGEFGDMAGGDGGSCSGGCGSGCSGGGD